MIKWLLILVLSWIAADGSASTGRQSHSELGSTAAVALEERALAGGVKAHRVEIFPLDQRVNLPKCGHSVDVLNDGNQPILGRVTVGMRCNTPEPWTIYLRGRVTSLVSIPVLNRPVSRSEAINESDIVVREIEIDTDLRGVLVNRDQIVRKVALRNLAAGKPLRRTDITAPQLITRGQSVTITSMAGGLKVTMQGKALGNAKAGDRLWVQNRSSKKRVEGVVTEQGKVLVQ